ncbi:MAG: hypothetical protein M3Q27_15630 [Actinomycetota bacterium]|nr:hypothetical protein [Actinomycetota bacterium]
MRWERLFADLEGQLDESGRADLDAEVADRTRAERSAIRLVDRLRAASGSTVTVVLDGRSVVGRVADVGADWVLLEETARVALVPLRAVNTLRGLGARARHPGSEGPVAGRRELTAVLRSLARDRADAVLSLTGGSEVSGVIERVGADHLDLAERGGGGDGHRLTVPLSALVVVRTSI